MLDGLSQTGGILDDLIVTCENDEQHVKNLHRTLNISLKSVAQSSRSQSVL